MLQKSAEHPANKVNASEKSNLISIAKKWEVEQSKTLPNLYEIRRMYRLSIVYLSYIYRISIVYLSYIYRVSIVFVGCGTAVGRL